ncbi:TetR/AcrR family transcriptional regulator [Modestobacter versicolor]|uniref:AcrR family transcriptional regulator n=1 Tax=Modestobacter versicolor TaxID=429133 RepID=A0A839Y177_9ACTN|nr:TetR/AcrR family transcriptional regulator [Modestobacter versicolor]MBB3674311.1 AcrR family transcriptional regulator [Modestobacter versicolor]
MSELSELGARRPQRADARRNFDALLVAAREVFSEQGVAASLEDVARRAGVGIGTLYRNFPTRQELVEAVYVGEIRELCQAARSADAEHPWDALVAWLRRFVDYVATKRALAEGLNRDSDVFAACREAMYAAGAPLLERAQAAGEARSDLGFDDLVRLVIGVLSAGFPDDDRRDKVLAIALDGVRTQTSWTAVRSAGRDTVMPR